ncbi:ubiquitin carboxyl-terminal hydrolase 37-like [Centroberyx affinis]|uniref:ubiquitin carboxyl-terminal hydrolase 37-like n=1 Tax=Centroberyx affinis TaxID=166261 RepID=UPI003A5BFC76
MGNLSKLSVENNTIDRIPAVPEVLGQEAPTESPGIAATAVSLELHCSGSLERLPNIGNTCFLNATLQALYSIPSFCADIMGQEVLWSPTNTSLKLQRCFGELYKARQGHSSYHSKSTLLRSVKSSVAVFNEEYEGDFQQDAHEFLMLFLMGMKMQGEMQQGTSTPDYICPTQNFEFKLQSVRTCSSCGDKVFQEEGHNNLSLDLSSCLADSLALYFKASELECTCRQCLGPQATVARAFLTLPRVLVLHIMRFCHNGGQLRRVGDAVCIPPVLSLASLLEEQQDVLSSPGGREVSPQANPFPSTASVDQQESSGDRDRSQQGAPVDRSVQSCYRLSAVVSHLGRSIDCGHYVSDVIEGHNGEWVTLDDSRVTRTDEAAVLKRREDTAYLLFYVLSGAGEGDPAPL